jgi:hypothetical protein
VVEGAELLEGELVLGRGDEVLLQGVELLGRDVEDHRDVVGENRRGGIRRRHGRTQEAVLTGNDDPALNVALETALRVLDVNGNAVAAGPVGHKLPAVLCDVVTHVLDGGVEVALLPAAVEVPDVVAEVVFLLDATKVRRDLELVTHTEGSRREAEKDAAAVVQIEGVLHVCHLTLRFGSRTAARGGQRPRC